MVLEYVPDTSTVGDVEFRPYMVEVAWNYCQLVLASDFHRGMIEQTLAALAIEIVLKSYNAVVAKNNGEVNESYVFQVPVGGNVRNRHNLVLLADLLREDLRSYLIEPQDEEVLRDHQDTFRDSRYYYEPDAPIASTDAAMKLAVKLICKTMYLYQQRGCRDSFVLSFNVNQVFFSYVQRFVTVQGAA